MKSGYLVICICLLTLGCQHTLGAESTQKTLESMDNAYKGDSRYIAPPENLDLKPFPEEGNLWRLNGLAVLADARWHSTWMNVDPTRIGIGFESQGRTWSMQFTVETFEQLYIDAAMRPIFRFRFPKVADLSKVATTELAVVDEAARLTRGALLAVDNGSLETVLPLIIGIKLSSRSVGDYRFLGKKMVAHFRTYATDVKKDSAWALLFDAEGRYRGGLILTRNKLEKNDGEFVEQVKDVLSRMTFEQ